MPDFAIDTSLFADDRAVAPLIGFILLFGLFVTAFAGYQATAVPQQNAETEFQHFQDVQDDMTVIRNAISTAGQSDVSQFESVKLGTTYRERILALNPPAAAGSLRTSDAYYITVEDDIVSSTRFLEYRNGYNEFEAGSIWYENSVVYLDERDDDGDGNVVILEEQNLVEDGKLRITALQNDYQESGIGRASVELYPVDVEDADDLSEYDGDVTVGIPTRLNGPEYWEAEIPAGLRGDPFVVPPEDNDYTGDDVYELRLEANVDEVSVNTVGIDSAPEDKAGAARQGVGGGESSSDCAIEQSGDYTAKNDVEGCIDVGGDVEIKQDVDVDGDIYADGLVTLKGSTTAQAIDAGGDVTIEKDAEVEGIDSGGNVELKENAKAGDINADGLVKLKENAEAGDINAGGLVTLKESTTAQAIDAGGDVTIEKDAEVEGIDSGGNVELKENAEADDINAGGQVKLKKNAEAGDINAGGLVTLKGSTTAQAIDAGGDVTIEKDAEVNGDIDSDGNVDLGDNATVEGDVFVDSAEDINCGNGSKINGKGCSGYKNSNY
ncbi:polymer-forming cytoskeletal protein [Natronomonas sp. LN261]|uniref:polymer-forming cytoskeletal protein n=1 Tax=Natronomonas sp. LN261 TaxID=2750669 RepID=UPI0015EF4CAA|nr:hypothetical protein [Natronomonas sp. LN261]